ncbi:MCE family protein [Mycolicibacterium sp. 3033]|nr:MCE family protein [Mycolicibacterium aurantiacum]
MLVVLAVLGAALFLQFRGDFTAASTVKLFSERAGLVVERGAKVTYNGVEIGRVAQIAPDADGGARLTLDVDPAALAVIPANAAAEIRATTVFGNKYISLMSPPDPLAQRLSDGSVLRADAVTTEFNTLFETVTEIAEQVDPVKLNQTLGATAEALSGSGERFGASLENGNRVLTEFDELMPQWRSDVRSLAALADIYADAAPDLFDGLASAVTTARTLSEHSGDVDAALIAAVGFADPATSVFDRGGPYLIRGAADLLPTTRLLDDYRGMMFCTIRNYAEVAPEITRVLGGDNGYSLRSAGTITGAGNPFVYPDNLPRVNARGGPEGRPGCWQKITRDLWPNPYLVMDTGYSLAPYNHVELGQPLLVDYVWGRQVGEYTINP